MRQAIQIPATLSYIQVVRIFKSTVGIMRLGEPDRTNNFTDIDIGDGVEIDHELAISTIEAWRRQSQNDYALAFAYQALAISRISDDRSAWKHRGRISEKVLLPITPKTYVLDAPWVKRFSLAWLRDDVEYYRHVRGRLGPETHLNAELRRRLVNAQTPAALQKLLAANPGLSDMHELLKLGAAVYVPFGNDMLYCREERANIGVRLTR